MLDTSDITTYSVGSFTVTSILADAKLKSLIYIIHNLTSNKCVIIDPGGNEEKILEFLGTRSLIPEYILLTHGHHDHLGAAYTLCEKYRVPINLHKNDARLLRHAPMYALTFTQKVIKEPKHVSHFSGEPTFSLNDHTVHTVHTPGHTSGGVCFILEKCIFTGDTLLLNHIGRTDLPGGNLSHIILSIDKILGVSPLDGMLFPGHGQPWSVKEAQEWWKSTRHSVVLDVVSDIKEEEP